MSGQAFIGLAAILTFSAISMANIEPASIREAEQTRATVSGAITAGMFSLVGGVALLFRRRFPIDTAREVADTYNAVLPSSK
jgi:nitrate reductase gamma subunit